MYLAYTSTVEIPFYKNDSNKKGVLKLTATIHVEKDSGTDAYRFAKNAETNLRFFFEDRAVKMLSPEYKPDISNLENDVLSNIKISFHTGE